MSPDRDKERLQKNLMEEALFWGGLGTLLARGVPIVQALEVMQKCTIGFYNLVEWTLEEIRDGDALYIALEEYRHDVQPFIPAIVQVGEDTGTLENAFRFVSDLIFKIAKAEKQGDTVSPDTINKLVDCHLLAWLIEAGLPDGRVAEIMSEASEQNEFWQNVEDRIKYASTPPATLQSAMREKRRSENYFTEKEAQWIVEIGDTSTPPEEPTTDPRIEAFLEIATGLEKKIFLDE